MAIGLYRYRCRSATLCRGLWSSNPSSARVSEPPPRSRPHLQPERDKRRLGTIPNPNLNLTDIIAPPHLHSLTHCCAISTANHKPQTPASNAPPPPATDSCPRGPQHRGEKDDGIAIARPRIALRSAHGLVLEPEPGGPTTEARGLGAHHVLGLPGRPVCGWRCLFVQARYFVSCPGNERQQED